MLPDFNAGVRDAGSVEREAPAKGTEGEKLEGRLERKTEVLAKSVSTGLQ